MTGFFNFTAREFVSIFVTVTVIMSGRKRKNYDPIDPRNWPKERYIERLKHMGIGINTSWKVEVLRQLYMANLPNNTIITSDQEEEINVV